MNKFIIGFAVILLTTSCKYFTVKSDESKKAIARVNSVYLYKEDLQNIITKDVTKQDSVLLVKNYIKNWIKHQLLLEKAKINLDDQSKEFDQLVKKYKEDLFINSYKEAVVTEYLNKEITNEDIEKFYNENNQEFILNEELLKLRYIKIGKDITNPNQLTSLFKSGKKEDLDKLEKKGLNLNSYHLDETVWVKYSEFVNKVPVFKNVDKDALLKNNSFVQKEDSLGVYLVAIKQVLRRNEIAPKSYITPTIKQMILHQRKLLLLRNIEETLIDDANKKQQFEIY
ncbi:peptidyl-prolyl cis-trans isomerase [Lutibacter sp.]|uniref:peptidyl-prolyl cis-trans isomerase n=1 Tax=Lutibacter sp. TaxID=1925666 RepID=UPI002735FDD6|nr:peptidyl-prolyl cis-trans isomerase [Lutibacter sp.]MDP3313072.1 peptidyl-prolyl cis-trans isomerase [Lutibacter sp.]